GPRHPRSRRDGRLSQHVGVRLAAARRRRASRATGTWNTEMGIPVCTDRSGLASRHEPDKPQIFPKKSEIRGNSTFYVLGDLIDLLMIPRKIGGWPDQRGFITVRGYSNMALKKTAGSTAGTAKKTAAKAGTAKKAAPKKA